LTGYLRLGSVRTTVRYLDKLEAEGLLERTGGARGMRPTRAPGFGTETVPVPLVGTAPAGALMVAEQNIEGWVRMPVSATRPSSAKFFLLRVRGNSMNRASVKGNRIESGDLVLVRQQAAANDRDIVVAELDGEATIKRFRLAKSHIALVPESTSAAHRPILVTGGFRVQGVVVDVLKQGTALLQFL
jgi:repressor LexA